MWMFVCLFLKYIFLPLRLSFWLDHYGKLSTISRSKSTNQKVLNRSLISIFLTVEQHKALKVYVCQKKSILINTTNQQIHSSTINTMQGKHISGKTRQKKTRNMHYLCTFFQFKFIRNL